jgi:translation initiation factor 2 beta subunit (eIF-2beta)/eIF-5
MRETEYFGEGGECLLCGMLAPRLIYNRLAKIQLPICETCQEMITEDVERRLVRIKERFPDKPRRRRS